MRIEHHFVFMTFMLGTITAQLNDVICRTPNNENGVCIVITHCDKVRKILEDQMYSETAYTFLKNSMCGFEGSTVKVCCPLEKLQPVSENIYHSKINTSLLPSSNTCGRASRIKNRIIGGNSAILGAWPWMVALGYPSTNRKNALLYWRCGGTLITKRHVITAAHCIINSNSLRPYIARLGELNLDPNVNDGASPIDIQIERIITHSRYYDGEKHINDIALLKLKANVIFTEFIQPICLPWPSSLDTNIENSMAYVTGWGITYESTWEVNHEQSNGLMELQIPIANHAFCKQAYLNLKTAVIDENVICAGFLFGGKDSCRGDSGGPLMIQKGKQFYLLGITSFGNSKCGLSGYPGVYTKVSSFFDWIIEKINKN